MAKSDIEKTCDRAAQDILNLLGNLNIELRQFSLHPEFPRRFSKSKIASLIQTRMMEGSYIRGESHES